MPHEARRRLLLAYDGSPTAATAVRVAASLFPDAHACVATVPSQPRFEAGGTPGLFVEGMSPVATQDVLAALDDLARRQADTTAERAVQQAETLGLDAELARIAPSTQTGAALLDAAQRLGADVLICGTRGRGAFARAVLGSTSSSLLHDTHVPLLVVPDGGGALDGPVAVAYDGSEGAVRATEVVGRLLRGRATVVVHAWEPPYRRALAATALAPGLVDDLGASVVQLHAALADRAAATTEAGVAAARAAGLDAMGDTVEIDDGAWRAVVGAARAHGASVIATGSRGIGATRSALLGSVSSGLVQNAELPVLVVPDEPAEDGSERAGP